MSDETYNTNGISNNENDEKSKIKLSTDDLSQTQNHNFTNNKINLPPIQNLNNLILSCVKNEEYCYRLSKKTISYKTNRLLSRIFKYTLLF